MPSARLRRTLVKVTARRRTRPPFAFPLMIMAFQSAWAMPTSTVETSAVVIGMNATAAFNGSDISTNNASDPRASTELGIHHSTGAVIGVAAAVFVGLFIVAGTLAGHFFQWNRHVTSDQQVVPSFAGSGTVAPTDVVPNRVRTPPPPYAARPDDGERTLAGTTVAFAGSLSQDGRTTLGPIGSVQGDMQNNDEEGIQLADLTHVADGDFHQAGAQFNGIPEPPSYQEIVADFLEGFESAFVNGYSSANSASPEYSSPQPNATITSGSDSESDSTAIPVEELRAVIRRASERFQNDGLADDPALGQPLTAMILGSASFSSQATFPVSPTGHSSSRVGPPGSTDSEADSNETPQAGRTI
ncbi:hypothetical protein NKR23_g3512 [Pleurostoma richardsiae]|uniref:Transmembrane protein n=1 Tax=Pleurostoma richardsiae TaxID=41990 RepID=A0AA38RUE3_9PEZI|nr:hypothetical protein NKR23_g3512 [Pleurostoma richardsiae]